VAAEQDATHGHEEADGAGGAGGRSMSPPAERSVSPPPADGKDKKKDEAEPAAPAEPTLSNVASLFEEIVEPVPAKLTMHPPVVIRARTKLEHEMLLNQAVSLLVNRVRNPSSSQGAIHLVPVAISLAKITELLADEQLAKQGARAVVVKAFELDHAMPDLLRQAMDMKALIFVCEVQGEADLASLMKDAIYEELIANRLIVTISGANSLGEPLEVPPSLAERATLKQTSTLGLYMNDIRPLSNRLLANLFRRLRTAGSEAQPSHYASVERLHIGFSEVGREGMQELQELLVSDDCKIKSMDLSFAAVEGWPLMQALKGNKSLTSLDVRSVPGLAKVYDTIATQLLDPNSVSRLACLRCDAFDLRESTKLLSVQEEPLEVSSIRLIAGLLKNNTQLLELDLTASDVEDKGATTLASVLPANTTLTRIMLEFNSALTAEGRKALREAAATSDNARAAPLRLDF